MEASPPLSRFARITRRPLALALALVFVAAILIVFATGMRPSYDPYGWLVWGRQALHLDLNTDGAPSWKPLTFLFTFPYALAGRGALWLWMVTAVAGSLTGAVFAARIAYRLIGHVPERRYAQIVAAAFAGLGVLGIDGYWHLILIANSDPIIVTLCLAAIDCHLSRRYRLSFVLLVLAALGRPEAWPFAGLYALWTYRMIPSMRILAALGVAAVPTLWFGIPALTSKSWMSAGNLALDSTNVLHGNKLSGVIGRFLGLYPLPMQLLVLFALVLAVAQRDRVSLLLGGAAILWVAIEIAFAFHGFSAVDRYLIEPAALTAVLAGIAVGRVLAFTPRSARVPRWAGPAAVVVLLLTLAPSVRYSARVLRSQIVIVRRAAVRVERLDAVVDRVGGAARIRGCGQPVTEVGFQSTLAWEVGLNVGNVGFTPKASIRRGDPIVLFEPHRLGWTVRAIHTRHRCRVLSTNTKF